MTKDREKPTMHPDIHHAIHNDRHADRIRQRRTDELARLVSPGWRARWRARLRRAIGRLRRWRRLATRHVLGRGQTLSRDSGPEPLTLVVRSGCVWATRSSDPEDHVLCTDGSIVVPEMSRLAVQALQPASLEIQHGAPDPGDA